MNGSDHLLHDVDHLLFVGDILRLGDGLIFIVTHPIISLLPFQSGKPISQTTVRRAFSSRSGLQVSQKGQRQVVLKDQSCQLNTSFR